MFKSKMLFPGKQRWKYILTKEKNYTTKKNWLFYSRNGMRLKKIHEKEKVIYVCKVEIIRPKILREKRVFRPMWIKVKTILLSEGLFYNEEESEIFYGYSPWKIFEG